MLSYVFPLFPVMLPVLLCAMVGVIWVRTAQPYNQEFVRRMVMWISAPALVLSTLVEVDIGIDRLQQIVLATLVMLAFSVVIAMLLCLVAGWSLRDFVVPLTIGNTGNMGMPVCLFAFGQEGLALAVGLFLISMGCHFSIGIAVLNGRAAVKAVCSSPVVYAGVLAAIIIAYELSVPKTITNTLEILGGMAIPLMLVTLGVSLGGLRVAQTGEAVMLGVARMVVGIGAALATVWCLELEGTIAKVVLVQGAMPAAIFNYLLAVQYQRSPQAVAGMVVSSTLMSFVTVPVMLLFIA